MATSGFRRVLIDGDNLYLQEGTLESFVHHLRHVVRRWKPDRLAVCFDDGPSEYRRSVYPAYKAARVYRSERSKRWHDLDHLLDVLNIAHVRIPGVEADDLIARYVRRSHRSDEVAIISGDKDFLQLLGPNAFVHDVWHDKVWTLTRFRNHYKFSAPLFPVYLAVLGDRADNIAGIPISPKVLASLVMKYEGDIDAMCSNHPKLFLQNDLIRRNLDLVDLKSVRFPVHPGPLGHWAPVVPGDQGWEKAKRSLTDLGLDAIVSQMESTNFWKDQS